MDRTMIFNYFPGSLSSDLKLMLTFTAPTQNRLSTEQNLVAWKVISMNATWGIPVNNQGNGNLIKARNATGYRQNVSVGTLQSGTSGMSVYSPSFMWKVGDKLTAEANFHPELKAYVNTGYQQNEFITADIASDMITSWNLAALNRTSNWLFTELPQGGYQITAIAGVAMVQEISVQEFNLDLHFEANLYWQETVPRHNISAVFAYISTTLAEKGDKDRHRKCIVSQKGVTCKELSAVLRRTIFEALEKECAEINGKRLTHADFDYYWSIADERGLHGGEEVIGQGSAAWNLLGM
ncbi:hypothetical protein FB45DRAFT_1054397 [Roridomyces roridus]|uniref:Uncharacterized protein n=1 Tax=Roridomyces roridus TaxID=1738132 RepID=A0AAD7C8R9_9AGAR|nr:hypothetical protein FB45DRAFT_1054397 [Roridomyces roridus]